MVIDYCLLRSDEGELVGSMGTKDSFFNLKHFPDIVSKSNEITGKTETTGKSGNFELLVDCRVKQKKKFQYLKWLNSYFILYFFYGCHLFLNLLCLKNMTITSLIAITVQRVIFLSRFCVEL